jgi:hypothetical protein
MGITIAMNVGTICIYREANVSVVTLTQEEQNMENFIYHVTVGTIYG